MDKNMRIKEYVKRAGLDGPEPCRSYRANKSGLLATANEYTE